MQKQKKIGGSKRKRELGKKDYASIKGVLSKLCYGNPSKVVSHRRWFLSFLLALGEETSLRILSSGLSNIWQL
jgi:hypothetical protein